MCIYIRINHYIYTYIYKHTDLPSALKSSITTREMTSSAFHGSLWMPFWLGSQLCTGTTWAWRWALLVPGIGAERDQSTSTWLVLETSAWLEKTHPMSLVSFYCWAGPWLQSMLPRCSCLQEYLSLLSIMPHPCSEERKALSAELFSHLASGSVSWGDPAACEGKPGILFSDPYRKYWCGVPWFLCPKERQTIKEENAVSYWVPRGQEETGASGTERGSDSPDDALLAL